MRNTSSEALSKVKVLLIVPSMPKAQNERMLPQQMKFSSIQNTETHNTLTENNNGLCQNKKTTTIDYSFHVRQNTSIFFSPRCHKRKHLTHKLISLFGQTKNK
jgi:hypothetical protein